MKYYSRLFVSQWDLTEAEAKEIYEHLRNAETALMRTLKKKGRPRYRGRMPSLKNDIYKLRNNGIGRHFTYNVIKSTATPLAKKTASKIYDAMGRVLRATRPSVRISTDDIEIGYPVPKVETDGGDQRFHLGWMWHRRVFKEIYEPIFENLGPSEYIILLAHPLRHRDRGIKLYDCHCYSFKTNEIKSLYVAVSRDHKQFQMGQEIGRTVSLLKTKCVEQTAKQYIKDENNGEKN